MDVKVCVGSSCHIRGSGEIIQLMKKNVSSNCIDDKINLSAVFCLGKCTDGVTVQVDDEIICGVSPDSFDDFFNKYILERE